MSERCPEGRWHVWKVVQRDEQPSGLEIARSTGMRVTRLQGEEWIVRPVIVTYRCDKCSSEKVKRV